MLEADLRVTCDFCRRTRLSFTSGSASLPRAYIPAGWSVVGERISNSDYTLYLTPVSKGWNVRSLMCPECRSELQKFLDNLAERGPGVRRRKFDFESAP